MATCPRCRDHEGRPRQIAITITRWVSRGTETTLRCPVCGWQGTRGDPALPELGSATEPAGQEEGGSHVA